MKVLKLIAPGNIKIKNIPIPKLNNNSLIIKIKYCAICSSDIKFINKCHIIKKYPITLGHEISGNVIKTGKNIKKFKTGDHVVLGAEIPCGKKNCFYCSNNQKVFCEKVQSVGTMIDGGFAEYIILDNNFIKNGPIIKISKKIDHKYTCLAESFACVINGIECADLKYNKSVLIIGSGYMGILFVLLCKKLYKFKNVCIVDINKKRLKIAKNIGADHILQGDIYKDNIKKRIFASNNNNKFDFVVSANDNIKSHKATTSFINKGGCINLFGGIPNGKDDKITISSNFIHYSQIKISGTFSSDIDHLRKAINFIIKNKNIVGRLITDIIDIKNIIKYFSLVKSNKVLKVLVKL